MNLNGTEYYYFRNAQDDIIGLVDNAGNVVVEYAYDAWGNILSTTGSLASTVGVMNPYRYRGYRYDSESGLYYLQSRYYNAQQSRFINADKFNNIAIDNETASLNIFTYCNNNPVNKIDSDGELAAALALPLLGAGPVGWVIFGIIAVAVIVCVIHDSQVKSFAPSSTINYAKNKAPTLRPGVKKQGKTLGEKKRGDPNWNDNSNKRGPKKQKTHHPSKKGHRKPSIWED